MPSLGFRRGVSFARRTLTRNSPRHAAVNHGTRPSDSRQPHDQPTSVSPVTLAAGAPPYPWLKGRATDFVPHPEGPKIAVLANRGSDAWPESAERGNLDTDAVRRWIDVGLR